MSGHTFKKGKVTASHPSCYHVGYSLSCAEYDDLRRLAKGRCQICGTGTEKLLIDHDHGFAGDWAVRGLVCFACNQHLRLVDAGRISKSPAVVQYLENAWHIGQSSSVAKAARVRPKRDCPTCGRSTAVHGNGRFHRHWSRLPDQYNTVCPGGVTDGNPNQLTRTGQPNSAA